jgi:hypothetical protein
MSKLYRVAAIFLEHLQSLTVTLKKYFLKILFPKLSQLSVSKHK